MKKRLITISVLSLFVFGCSTVSEKQTIDHQTAKEIETNGKSGTQKEFTKILQFLEASSKWPKTDGNGEEYLDAYTRLIVYSDYDKYDRAQSQGGEFINSREYSQRNWLERLWSEKTFSTTLTLEVETFDYKATVPLVVMEYSSSRESGEAWYRMLATRKESMPLFLVKGNGRNSRLQLKFMVHKNQQTKSQAGEILQSTLKTIEKVAPQVAVVTSLNKHFTDAAKNAIDDSISANFSKALKEDLIRDISLVEAGNGSNIRITFRDSLDESVWETEDLKEIGRWSITFDFPRPSIFSAYRICPKSELSEPNEQVKKAGNACVDTREKAELAVLEDVKASEVLNFNLMFGADDKQKVGTIESYIKQQSWFTDYLAMKEADLTSNAAKICNHIKSAITAVNLNELDSKIVVWAVMDSMPLPPKVSEKLNSSTECMAVFSNLTNARKTEAADI